MFLPQSGEIKKIPLSTRTTDDVHIVFFVWLETVDDWTQINTYTLCNVIDGLTKVNKIVAFDQFRSSYNAVLLAASADLRHRIVLQMHSERY